MSEIPRKLETSFISLLLLEKSNKHGILIFKHQLLDKLVFFMVDIFWLHGFMVLGGYRHFLGGDRVFEGEDAPKRSIFGLTSPYIDIAPPTLNMSIFYCLPSVCPTEVTQVFPSRDGHV